MHIMVGPWLGHGWTMVGPWSGHGRSMVGPWSVYGRTMVGPCMIEWWNRVDEHHYTYNSIQFAWLGNYSCMDHGWTIELSFDNNLALAAWAVVV